MGKAGPAGAALDVVTCLGTRSEPVATLGLSLMVVTLVVCL